MVKRLCMESLCIAVAALLAGCASSPSREFSGFVDTYPEMDREDMALGPDAPERPSSGLPPLEELVEEHAELEEGDHDITIQRDTLLGITVKEDPVLSGAYPVNELGAIQFGYVGPVFLYNKTVRQAEQKITDLLERRYLRRATVTVRMQRASYEKVWMSGGVLRPGPLKIGAGDTITLNDAILRAGGLKVPVHQARVRIVRGGLLTAVAPALPGEVYRLMNDEGKPEVPDVGLTNNDVAYVYAEIPTRRTGGGGPGAKTILVLGEVKQEGFLTFGPNEGCTVMHLIFKMGGLPPYANDKAIRLIRRGEDGVDHEIRVNARRILEDGNPDYDVPLENGDRVIVPARRIAFF